jgi:hypothetical protein
LHRTAPDRFPLQSLARGRREKGRGERGKREGRGRDEGGKRKEEGGNGLLWIVLHQIDSHTTILSKRVGRGEEGGNGEGEGRREREDKGWMKDLPADKKN